MVWLPGNLVSDHSVEDEEQLAHGHDEHHLPALTPPEHEGVEGTDGRVVAAVVPLVVQRSFER